MRTTNAVRGWNRCDCCGLFVSPDRDGWRVEEMFTFWDVLKEDYFASCGRCQEPDHSHKDAIKTKKREAAV